MKWRHAASSTNRMVLLAIGLVTIVFMLLVSNAFYGADKKSDRLSAAPALATQSLASIATELGEEDTDGDGLADWEELLWDTDPTNPDSDGNGVLDGAERNSEIALSTKESDGHDGSLPSFQGPKTATDAVAQELFGTYMQTFAEKNGVTPDEQQLILKRALGSVGDFVEPPSYGEDDVHVVAVTPEQQFLYAETARAILKDIQEHTPGEYDALAQVTQGNRAEAIDQLRTAADIYSNSVDLLKDLLVPQDAVKIHVVLIRALEGYAQSLEHIAELEVDPMLASLGLASFMQHQTVSTQAMQALVEYWAIAIETLQQAHPKQEHVNESGDDTTVE